MVETGGPGQHTVKQRAGNRGEASYVVKRTRLQIIGRFSEALGYKSESYTSFLQLEQTMTLIHAESAAQAFVGG